MRDHLEFTLPATLDLSPAVRQLSKDIFKWMGFSLKQIQQWELIVDELFMNAVSYGSDPSEAAVYLRYQKTPHGAHFSIEDEGNGPKKISAEALKEKIMQHQKEAKLTDTSGRGLALIMEKWTDRHNIESSAKGGILVWVEKNHEDLSTAVTEKQVIEVHPRIGRNNTEFYLKPIEEAIATLKEGDILELDFEHVDYINSIVIGHLTQWQNQARAKKANIILSHLKKSVKEVLLLMGLDRLFNFSA